MKYLKKYQSYIKTLYIHNDSKTLGKISLIRAIEKFSLKSRQIHLFQFEWTPSIPLDVEEPSLAAYNQALLKDFDPKLLKASRQEEFMKYMGQDILKEKQKIGGDWAVAYAVPTRKMRDIIKQECNAMFIVLKLCKDLQIRRLLKRQPELKKDETDRQTSKDYEDYESVQSDETNAYELEVTPDLDAEMVLEKVLEIIKKLNNCQSC